jgi:hypothetical protein
MAKDNFDSPEAYILGQKYNIFNRKARTVKKLVADGAKVLIPYKGIVVLTQEKDDLIMTTTVSGSVFFPIVDLHITQDSPSQV